jgi:hypothetical protein
MWMGGRTTDSFDPSLIGARKKKEARKSKREDGTIKTEKDGLWMN